jgi:uncharacterized protein (DUF2249 family)
MEKHNLNELIEYNDAKPSPKVLMSRPGYRLVLLNMRSGQMIPEHATKEMVTVYSISGHITFYAEQQGCDLRAGEVLCVDAGVPLRLEAHGDSVLLVIAAGDARPSTDKTLDLRAIPRPERHSLVFAKFDQLVAGESFVLINDHDPVSLNRQMEATRPGQVAWEYIERGPDSFRIRVRRTATPDGPKNSTNIAPEGQLHEVRRV